MKFKPLTYFLCAVTLVIILISPWLILSQYQTPAEAVTYHGIVRLWHITQWRTGGSSGLTFLSQRITAFETYNARVIIEIESMTEEQARQALSDGKTPDIISYPAGVEWDLPFIALPQKELAVPSQTDAAYPYMCGGYCIVINTEMMDESGLFLTDDWGIRPDNLLDAAALGICFDAEDGYSPLPAIALHTYPADSGPNISTWKPPQMPDAALQLSPADFDDGFEAFCDAEAGVLIASHRQLFELRQSYMQGDAPAFYAYAIGGYTDMVQNVSVRACEDEKKQAVCTAFAEYLVSNSVQMKLEAIGVLPVAGGLDIYEDDPCLAAMYTLISDDPVMVLPQESAALGELAQAASGGDSRALRQLRQKLRHLS
jgi:hypothetical protein